MEQLINCAELFSPGTAKAFDDLGKVERIKNEAAKILSMAGAVKRAHIDGSPNNSRLSTENAVLSADALVCGMVEQEKPERFFGENVREAIKEFKDFFTK